MITKKMLAIGCLFLAVPVCAMKRRVCRRAFKNSRYFGNKHLSTAVLSSKQKGQRNKIFVSSGVPINFIAKRLLCTEKQESKAEKELYKKVKSLQKQKIKSIIASAGSYVALCGVMLASVYSIDSPIVGDTFSDFLLLASGTTISGLSLAVSAKYSSLVTKEINQLDKKQPQIFRRIEEEKRANRNRLKNDISLMAEAIKFGLFCERPSAFPANWSSDALCKDMLHANSEIERGQSLYKPWGKIISLYSTPALIFAGSTFYGSLDSYFSSNIFVFIALNICASAVGLTVLKADSQVRVKENKRKIKELKMLAKKEDPDLYEAANKKYKTERLRVIKKKYGYDL